jgi:hypothetical protein
MPHKTQTVVLVQPAVKKRLNRCSDVTGLSITRMLEIAADGFEKLTLGRLKPAQRPLYLDGELTAKEAFRKNQFLGRLPADTPRVTVSAKLKPEQRAKLDRYAEFWNLPLSAVIQRISANWEKRVLAGLKPEQHADFLAGKLTREKMFPPVADENDDE